MSTPLGDHFFRHEYGRLVSTLSRRFGPRHIEAIEDAAQVALMSAFEVWTRTESPENPSAWLFRVAHNQLLGELRTRSRRELLLEEHSPSLRQNVEELPVWLEGEVRDDLLRMLFVCCDEAIPVESQLVLALKTLCGFEVREIAQRLFSSEANVYKRLGRARSRLRELPLSEVDLGPEQLGARLPAVHSILYLLFTEGYLSSHPVTAIRRELCDEALRLTRTLAEHPRLARPETFALLGLMHLHAARLSARHDPSGGLILLEEQARELWDQHEIKTGLTWLAKSAQGESFTRYHAEAGIAAEHCLAASFADTRWDRIIECYELLEQLAPSSLHTLNRAVAMAELRGPAFGLAVLEGREPPSWLASSYQWSAVLADLHRRCGHEDVAQRHAELALAAAPSPAIRDLIRRRLLGPG